MPPSSSNTLTVSDLSSSPPPSPMSAPQTRLDTIKSRTQKVPLTAEGLPIGYYRSDLLPPQSPPTETELDAAFVELSYEEGFPALPSGAPFWHRLTHEAPNAYLAFQIYADPNVTLPQSSSSTDNQAAALDLERLHAFAGSDATEHVRMLARVVYHPAVRPFLPMDANEALIQVQDWYHTYYWKFRVKALELYKESAYRLHRQRRALITEDKHYRTAEKLFNKCSEVMDTDDFWESLQPKEVIDIMKTAASLQRISAGLPGAAPLSAREEALAQLSGQSTGDLELIMRSTAKKRASTTSQGYTLDADGRIVADHNSLMSDLLDDPDMASVVQEVIIKMTSK